MAIDPNIKKKADDIRNKVYGQEVRESLASGLEAMSSDVVDTVSRQGNVESQFQDVIENTTDKDVISAPEIIAARDGEANLKARLDKENQEVTTQLEQIAVNVKTFGAKGDGETDDYENIQNTIDYVFEKGGGTVLIPIGEYLILETLKIKSNVHLKGMGKNSIIKGQKPVSSETTTTITVDELGADSFKISDLMFDSPNFTRQLIYIDKAKDYIIENIWTTGRTLYHSLDINNSENGIFKNIHLKKHPDGDSVIQIDSLGGMNKNLLFDGVYIKGLEYNSNKTAFVSREDAAIDIHNTNGGENVTFKNVYVEDVELIIGKGQRQAVNNFTFENFHVKNTLIPNLWGSGATQGVTFKNWYVESPKMIQAIGKLDNIYNLTIDNFHVTTDELIENIGDLEYSNSVVLNNIKLRGEAFPLGQRTIFDKLKTNRELLLNDTGEWKPKIIDNNGTEVASYTRQDGWYSRSGNAVTLNGRLAIQDWGDVTGILQIANLPFDLINSNLRAVGNVGLTQGFRKDTIIALQAQNQLRFFEGQTLTEIKRSDFENEGVVFTFTISYIAK